MGWNLKKFSTDGLEVSFAGRTVFNNNWLEMKSFLQKVGSNRLLALKP
jgi:hypothetical protein